jgi:hypothetical protein
MVRALRPQSQQTVVFIAPFFTKFLEDIGLVLQHLYPSITTDCETYSSRSVT